MSNLEYQESTSITFEWTLKDLKSLFESTKGEAKSKVTKSVRFGGGRWQILFYANSGTEGGYVSLYLSCEPTTDERDNVFDGKWVRDGVFKFSFELRNTSKSILFNSKEANNHSFSWKTANWGWAQFARRDHVYFNSLPVKEKNAFAIICTITSSPATPLPYDPVPCRSVPKELLETLGSLLDDPVYSDVEFVFPRQRRNRLAKKIYANRKLIEVADYFKAMFSSGFSETNEGSVPPGADRDSQSDPGDLVSEAGSFSSSKWTRHFEDSDDEDDEVLIDGIDHDIDEVEAETTLESAPSSQITISSTPSGVGGGDSSTIAASSTPTMVVSEDTATVGSDNELDDRNSNRNVRPKLSHPSSPRSRSSPVSVKHESGWHHVSKTDPTPGPSKLRVVVKDVAYTTYRGVLYYIYTDMITFAPLSSSFDHLPQNPIASTTTLTAQQSPNDSQNNLTVTRPQQVDLPVRPGPASRREWIMEWQANNPGRPTPCSAKAVYRLSDRLDLHGLKERAFQHIKKSLSVQNIAYEVFSPFSAAFADVRKVQVEFFLEHWSEIRTSDAMSTVWQQIRVGRHPGFEEVWPVIAQNLEFKPKAANSVGDASASEQ